uniref:Uncharacterized protein n=1 Tax=Haptolina ericina TaxID=156174 RepID=A0A7S3BX14_9EUKA|mmetsp:Transcript_7011/g.15741  ORF Transcript_7011/g.15741 Transcript_7011/m.15741 type:complete len:109 (+) Transcript_7011:60-386(+)
MSALEQVVGEGRGITDLQQFSEVLSCIDPDIPDDVVAMAYFDCTEAAKAAAPLKKEGTQAIAPHAFIRICGKYGIEPQHNVSQGSRGAPDNQKTRAGTMNLGMDRIGK